MDLTILVSLECSFLGFSDWKTNESFKLSLIKLLFEEEFDLSPCALPSFRFLEDFLLEMLLDPNLKSLRDAIQLVERPDSGTASLPLLLEIKLIIQLKIEIAYFQNGNGSFLSNDPMNQRFEDCLS